MVRYAESVVSEFMSKYRVIKAIDKMEVGDTYNPVLGAFIYVTNEQLKGFKFEDYFEPLGATDNTDSLMTEDDLNKIETVVGYLEPLLNDIDRPNSGKWHFMRDVIDEAEDWVSELRSRANTSPVVRKPKEGGVKANELSTYLKMELIPKFTDDYLDEWTSESNDIEGLHKIIDNFADSIETLIATRTVEARINEVWNAYVHHSPSTSHKEFMEFLSARTQELAASIKENQE